MGKLTKRQQKTEKFKLKKKLDKQTKDKNVDKDEESPKENKETEMLPEEAREKTEKVEAEKTDTKNLKKRFILFVGNLAYDTTKEDLQLFFAKCGKTQARLMTDKRTKKPKGFAFVEFNNAQSLEAALKLNQKKLKSRSINIELTAGGGGNTSHRLEKIRLKNEKLVEESFAERALEQ